MSRQLARDCRASSLTELGSAGLGRGVALSDVSWTDTASPLLSSFIVRDRAAARGSFWAGLQASQRYHLPAQEDGDSCQNAEEQRDRSRRKLALPGMEERRAHHDEHQARR